MKIIAVIQARMSSSRLPGKVLMDLGGRPLLFRMIQRVRRAGRIDGLVVATSVEPSDQSVADFCAAAAVPCVRGSLEDVARRFLAVMDAVPADAYVRLCADSPLMDPAVVDGVIALYAAERPDLATNVHPRTFPAGLSVEVINPETFRRVIADCSTPARREHVTRFFYEQAERFRIVNFVNPDPLPPMDLSVNTPEQGAALEELWRRFGERWDRLGWREAAAFLRAEALA